MVKPKKGGSKVIKSSNSIPGGGHKGGSGHMFGKQSAGTVQPGKTGKTGSGGGKWGKGGSGHMFGKQAANPMGSGKTGKG